MRSSGTTSPWRSSRVASVDVGATSTSMVGVQQTRSGAQPAQFDALGQGLRKEDVKEKMRVSADVERHLEWLAGDVEMGFEEINLHCVHRGEQERFIDVFGERVIPRLAEALT